MSELTGQLLADFSDFTRAVDTAVVSLKGFETGAGKVESSLNRMVDNFSGRKVVQDATLMAEAVEKIGGSSKLTDAELQKVGATAEAAAFKLRAMGQAVPPQIEALANDFKNLNDSTTSATSSFTTLVGSFVSAQAIIAGAEKAFDAVVDLVKELGQLALEGAAVSDVTDNFRHLTEQTGRLGDTLLGALRTGTHNTISDFELMKVANKDLAAGLNLTDDQFATLAKGAFALAQATGTDVKQGLETMNDAMLTGRGRALALLTGKIDLKAAEEAYATTLGTTADRLTEDEKLYADRHAMLDAVTSATARLGEQTDGLDEHVAQAHASWDNFRLSLGKTIAESKTLEAGFTTLRTALIDAFGGTQQALIDAIAHAVDQAAIVVVDFALAAIEGARDFNIAWSLVKTVVLGVETGLVTMAAAATEAYARIAKGATYLPGATDETRRMATEARAAADDMWNLSQALDNETQEAFKGVTGHSEFDQTLDKLGGVLFRTRDAMVAASTATGTQTEAAKGATAATQAAADATAQHGAVTRQTAADLQHWRDAVREMESAGQGWKGTLDTIDGAVVEAIKYYLDAGVAQDKLATAYGLTAAQIKAVASELKNEADAQTIAAKATADATKLWDEYYTLLVAHGGTATDAQIAQIDQWYQDTVAKLQLAGTYNEETATAVWSVWQEKLAGVKVNWTDVKQHSKNALQEIADKARATADYVLANSGQFSADYIRQKEQEAAAAERAAYHWRDTFDEAGKAASASVAKAADEMIKKFGEISHAAQQATLQMGGTFGVDQLTAAQFDQLGGAARLQQIQQSYQANPGRQAGGTGSTGLNPNDTTGYLAMLQEQRDFAALLAYAQSHHIPGFAGGVTDFGGGPAIVGEHGPELLYLPTGSSVVPQGQSAAVVVNNTFHLVDTESNLARRVSDLIKQSIMRSTRIS